MENIPSHTLTSGIAPRSLLPRKGVSVSNLMRWRYGWLSEYVIYFKKTHFGSTPWRNAYRNIKGRCENPRVNKYKYYGGKGIKNLLTVKDLFRAFMRDGAWTQKNPSVDRIDSMDHYHPNNIQWIDFSKNRIKRARITRRESHFKKND